MSILDPKNNPTKDTTPISRSAVSLTDKEMAIAEATLFYRFEHNFSVPQTAQKLNISVATYKTHIRNIYQKLDVHSLLQFKIAFEWAKKA